MRCMKATRGAREDLLGILAAAAAVDAAAARRLLRRLRAALQAVDDGETVGRVVPELGDGGLREVVEAPYRMVFADVRGRLFLLAVHEAGAKAPGHSSGMRG